MRSVSKIAAIPLIIPDEATTASLCSVPGDVYEQQPDVETGEIVAVLIHNDTATLKQVYKIDGTVILRSENPHSTNENSLGCFATSTNSFLILFQPEGEGLRYTPVYGR